MLYNVHTQAVVQGKNHIIPPKASHFTRTSALAESVFTFDNEFTFVCFIVIRNFKYGANIKSIFHI